MNPRLAQCYYALPDLDDVRYAIEDWFQHELIDTRSYVTEEEMYDLYDRVNEMKASSIELAFLYTFLIAAGAASLTQTSQKSVKVLESLYSIKSARRFAGMIFELITIDQIEQQQQAAAQMQSMNENLATTSSINDPTTVYDWKCLARCPTALLHCRLHSMLCCFFHQARDESRSVTHGNHAIRFARKYGLFEQIREAQEEISNSIDGTLSNTSKYNDNHLYALLRLQFDLTVYPRLSMTINPNAKRMSKNQGKMVEKCILLDTEACQDPSMIASTRRGQKLSPLAFDFQCCKLILSEIRAMAFNHTEQELKMNAVQILAEQEEDLMYGTDAFVRAEARRIRKKEQAANRSRRAVANDDVILALMDLLPSWTKVDVKSNWMQESSDVVMDAGSIINMLWARYSCNRLRTENLMQTCELYEMSWELQSRALSAAQDTIYLLAQVRQLLRSPFQFASAREWLFNEAEWAVNVFNQLMQIEITREMNSTDSSDQQTIEIMSRTPTKVDLTSSSSYHLSRESTPVKFNTPVPASSSKDSRRSSQNTVFSPTNDTVDRRFSGNSNISTHSTNATSEGQNLTTSSSLQIQKRRKAIGGDESGQHFISMQVAATIVEMENLEEAAKQKTYKGFAWFIFGFQGIYTVLQDLHCFGPASFEASRTLLRIQNPPKPTPSPTFTAESEKVLLEEIYHYNARLRGGSSTGIGSNGSSPTVRTSSPSITVLEEISPATSVQRRRIE